MIRRRKNALELFQMRLENGILALFEDENGNYIPPEKEREEWERLTGKSAAPSLSSGAEEGEGDVQNL
jgi:hypothetical protein